MRKDVRIRNSNLAGRGEEEGVVATISLSTTARTLQYRVSDCGLIPPILHTSCTKIRKVRTMHTKFVPRGAERSAYSPISFGMVLRS